MSIKANRSIFQRLVVAYEGKRNVDLQQIFKHELMPVPTALANLNGTLRSGTKSLNKAILKQDVICLQHVPIEGFSFLIIDGQAHVISTWKAFQYWNFWAIC